MTDSIPVKKLVVYAQTSKGVEYIKKDMEGNFVLAEGLKGALMFTPPEAQRFIKAASNFPQKLLTQAVQ